MVWAAFWAFWGSLGSLLEPPGAILGRLEAKLGWFGAPFGAFQLLMIFWNYFESENDSQKEAFGEAKRSKNRSQIEVQI